MPTERRATSKLNAQVYEQACEWFIEFRAGDIDATTRHEFDLWMRQSPEHLAAYLEIAAIWNEGPSLDPMGRWDTDQLIAQAARDPDNVVALSGLLMEKPGPSGSGQSATVTSAKRSRYRWVALIAAIGFVAFSIGWVRFLGPPTYATTLGEQRSIKLADGTIVDLNSDSKIRVRYSAHERTVVLLEGQALFNVQKDPARPFIVNSDTARVRAVGTQFDVYKKRDGIVVTVVEGRVAVVRASAPADEPPRDALDVRDSSHGSAGPESNGPEAVDVAAATPGDNAEALFLVAGEQATVTPKTVEKSLHPNVSTATAWTQRQLVFESASLSEVAEEFNRYNERQLIIQDPALYDFHISGVFSSTDPTSFILFLRQRPGVEVIETDAQIRVLRKIS